MVKIIKKDNEIVYQYEKEEWELMMKNIKGEDMALILDENGQIPLQSGE